MQAEQKLASNTAVNLSDYDAINRTVQHYIDGGKTGKSEEMKLAFHPDATIFGYTGPDFFGGPISKTVRVTMCLANHAFALKACWL